MAIAEPIPAHMKKGIHLLLKLKVLHLADAPVMVITKNEVVTDTAPARRGYGNKLSFMPIL